MVSSLGRQQGTYDFHMEYGGNSRSFILLRDENGHVGWRTGWAPMLPEEQRAAGAFEYQQLPAAVDIPVAFDCWHPGAGVEDIDHGAPPGRCMPYSYARGVDASWGQRAYLSPQRQTTTATAGAAISAPPDYYQETTLGAFMAAGRYMYEWSGTVWTLRETMGAGLAYTGPPVEFNGNLFAPAGANPYQFSTDGVTWTDSTLADNLATFFTVRGREGTSPTLWKVDADGNLKTNTDGTNGGAVAWSAAIPTGHTSETVTGLLTAEDRVWVFKREGIYLTNGSSVLDVFKAPFHVATNGLNPIQFSDGLLYAPYGNRLLQYDPQNNTYRYDFPTEAMVGNEELNGEIYGLTADEDYIYFMLKNSAGNYYVMKGRHGAYHPIAYLGANASDASKVFPAGDIHSTNPVLLFRYDTEASYFILPRPNMLPEDDSACLFDTGTTNRIWGPWVEVGAKLFPKALNGGSVLGRSLSATSTVTLSYEADESGTVQDLLTATSNGITSISLGPASFFPYTFPFLFTQDISFHRLRYRITLATGAATTTPVLHGALFNTHLRPPRKRVWSFDVLIGNDLPLNGGGTSRYAGSDLESFLMASHDQRVVLTDRDGSRFIVRVLDINAATNVRALPRGDVYALTVLCIEISQLT